MRPTDSSRPSGWVFAAQIRLRLAELKPIAARGLGLRLKYPEIDKPLPYSTSVNVAQMTRSVEHQLFGRLHKPSREIGGIPVRDREGGLFSTRLDSDC